MTIFIFTATKRQALHNYPQYMSGHKGLTDPNPNMGQGRVICSCGFAAILNLKNTIFEKCFKIQPRCSARTSPQIF